MSAVVITGWLSLGDGGDDRWLPEGGRRAKVARSSDGLVDEGMAVGVGVAGEPTVMNSGIDDQTFEALVGAHYEALYRFAFSLVQSESDARDLVQEAYAQLARKGGQIKSVAKAKSWLFTTLYRAFVDGHRKDVRHPRVELEEAEPELPVTEPSVVERVDGASVMAALERVDEVFRAPLVLFYLEDHSYLEIAEILGVPPGTVMSRISRGRALLRRMFEESATGQPGAVKGSGKGMAAAAAVVSAAAGVVKEGMGGV